MAEKRKIKGWFTMNGKHVPIFEGESQTDAYVRMMDKDMKKHPEWEKHVEELEKHDEEMEKKAQVSKKAKQIDKDFDEKEKQIKQNEEEKDRLNGKKVTKEEWQARHRERAKAKGMPEKINLDEDTKWSRSVKQAHGAKPKINITTEARDVGRKLYDYMMDNDISYGSKKWHQFLEKEYAKTDKSMTLEEFKRAASFVSIHQ